MSRIGIYGGTFNPPHVGHLQAARYAAKTLALDRLLLIPACISPGKEQPEHMPAPDQRLRMLQLAVREEPGFSVLDLELARGGVSYTCDTVAQLRRSYPQDELILLVGSDMFLKFLDWYRPEAILQDASLGVFCRGLVEEKQAILEQKTRLEQMGATVHVLDNPVTAISSTDLRRMLVFQCADPFLPESVADYIRENKLYGTGKSYHGLSMEELEKAVVSLLKPNRVAHVLGCRQAARDLARRWGVDETDAQRAALLHDITKAIDGPLQLTLCRQYGIILDNFSAQNPKTLHALTGGFVAQRIFGENPAVVSAIHSHTTGKADMNMLEKIIYVADYMEPNRDFPGVEELRRLAYTDMDGALRLGLEMTLEQLRRQGREISPASQEALAYLEQHKK